MVVRGDALEHVAREDVEILGLEIVELDEAAAAAEVVVKRAQFGGDFEICDGLHVRLTCRRSG